MREPRFYGVVIGLVSDVRDPEDQGRIKLSFPWYASEAHSGWAPIARPMAGKDRGFFYQPEVDDEVLVAFMHGDFNHPMVLGFLHNGVDLPPHQGIDEHVRRLKTVAGHVLEFDDRTGQESVRLHTNGGHQLELSNSGAYIELVTAAGQKIRMQDQPGQIELSTVAGTTVTIDDLPSQIELRTSGGVVVTVSDTGGVSVSAPTGGVTVNSMNAQVTSMASASVSAAQVSVDAAMFRVNAGMATFSGVVQCQTLISSSVVSASYTPGAGNLW